MMVKLRKDGWPLCPNCGADELYTCINSLDPRDHYKEIFRCCYCPWIGRIELVVCEV